MARGKVNVQEWIVFLCICDERSTFAIQKWPQWRWHQMWETFGGKADERCGRPVHRKWPKPGGEKSRTSLHGERYILFTGYKTAYCQHARSPHIDRPIQRSSSESWRAFSVEMDTLFLKFVRSCREPRIATRTHDSDARIRRSRTIWFQGILSCSHRNGILLASR